MIETVEATFDGKVLRPDRPIRFKKNARVKLTVEDIPARSPAQMSFLDTARSLNLDGPSDWSSNLDHYLYEPASSETD